MHCVRANFYCRFAVLIFALPCPYDFPTPVPPNDCCVLSGVFSRGSFFFLCRFWSFSCWCSFSSGCWLGVVWWLLFVVVASFVPFVLGFCGLGFVCVSFWCCVVCVFVFSVGRVFRGGASWCLFCFWFGVGCFCPCGALSCFRWGFVPLFLCDRYLRNGYLSYLQPPCDLQHPKQTLSSFRSSDRPTLRVHSENPHHQTRFDLLGSEK